MALAFDAFSESSSPTSGWTHTPSGTPRAVTVYVYDLVTPPSDRVTGVTYGGSSMTEVSAASPLLHTGNVTQEDSCLHAYTLLTSVPTGAQTVQVSGTASHGYCITHTGDEDGEIDATITLDSLSVDDPSVTLATTAGRDTAISGFCHSGLASTSQHTSGSGYTELGKNDHGSTVSHVQRRTSNGTGGNITCSWNYSLGADDTAIIAIALGEAAAGAVDLPRPAPNLNQAVETAGYY